MVDFTRWYPADTARFIEVPSENDHKYSRGVLGVITGSKQYPGAAVLGVEAALRTGVGMVRYIGPSRPSDLVLQRRPEVVLGAGRVQAWLIGSGMDVATMSRSQHRSVRAALDLAQPAVLDGGALAFLEHSTGPTVITPHAGELANLLGVERESIDAAAAERASAELGVAVLLKGHESFAVGGARRFVASEAPSWLATAGAGDALAGILGALVATRRGATTVEELAELAASAAVIHGLAAHRASRGGPLTVLDLAAEIAPTIAELINPAGGHRYA